MICRWIFMHEWRHIRRHALAAPSHVTVHGRLDAEMTVRRCLTATPAAEAATDERQSRHRLRRVIRSQWRPTRGRFDPPPWPTAVRFVVGARDRSPAVFNASVTWWAIIRSNTLPGGLARRVGGRRPPTEISSAGRLAVKRWHSVLHGPDR